MNVREIANLTEMLFFGICIFLMMGIVLVFLSGSMYALLKKFFGKPAVSAESEPGQILKKAKKAAAAPAVVEAFTAERIEPTFGDNPVLAKTDSNLLADDEPEAEPDAAVVQRDAAFADRMADQFAAEPVPA